MKIIITAGGTSEKIDDVRTITNSSTGNLGKAIAQAFASYAEVSDGSSQGDGQDITEQGADDQDSTIQADACQNSTGQIATIHNSTIQADTGHGETAQAATVHLTAATRSIEKIYYLHGLRAVLPEHPLIEKIPIGGVMDLKENLTRILTEDKIDICIHAMAVSDYMVHRVTTLDKLLGTEDPDNAQDLTGNKISSDIEDLIIHMKRSPKVISEIKKMSPETVLVGFKLLSGVPHQELIDVGYRLLQKNDCDFVMANDLREIGEGCHKGYLIHRDKTYDSMETNEEIADMIVRRTTERIATAD